MVEIMVVRHGQSVADITNQHEGRADFPLTEEGLLQAKMLMHWLERNWKPEVLFSSTLMRARQTVEVMLKEIECLVYFSEDLMERNNGVLAGMPREEAALKYPQPPGGWKRHESIKGGESEIVFRSRAEKFISELFTYIENHQEIKRICIVSHGGMISMLFRSFLNLPYDTSVYIPTGDTGIHIWRYSNGVKTIIKTNMQDHLEA